jgi:hypothetical protein
MDPAVLELEQFMLQELAAAGVIVNDSGSATELPTVPATAAASAQPQPVWQQAPMNQQHIPLQQQQQQQQLRPSPPPPQQRRQPCALFKADCQQWANPVACNPPEPQPAVAAYAPDCSTPAAAAAGVWVPAGACGSNLPSPGAAHTQHGGLQEASMPAAACSALSGLQQEQQLQQQQQQQQHGGLQVLHLPAAADAADADAGVRGSSSRAEMMARLQSRLHVLQSQMEDMQLMLGLLKEA